MRKATQIVAALLLIAMMFPSVFVLSQTPEEVRQQELRQIVQQLEARKNKIENDLGVTRTEKDSLQKEINKIRGQINYMQSIIQSTEAKIELTDIEIGGIENNISETQKLIDKRLGAIGRLIVLRDRQDQEGLIVSLIRFEHISDFFQRVRDVVTIHSRLVGLISELNGYRVALEMDKNLLEGKKGSLESLSQEQEYQQYGLVVAKSAKDKVLKVTKGKESEYQKQVAEIEKQKQALFKELQELELKIANGGLYIVRYTATNIPPAGTKIFERPKGWLTQGYGMTRYARRGAYGGAGHNGLDIASGYGTPIRAIGAGQIVANGTNDGWGNWIAIKHPNNMVSVYAHMSTFAGLSIGTNVTQSQVIGYEGSTGKVTGSHLHLSLYKEFFTYINDRDGQLYFNYFKGSINPGSYM